MADKPLALCRGIQYCYLAFEFDSDAQAYPRAVFSGRELSTAVPVYPLDFKFGVEPRLWVAVFPHLQDEEQSIEVFNGDASQPIEAYRFTYKEMKWQSRLDYRMRKQLTRKMRGIEERFASSGIRIRLLDVLAYDACEDVMRIEVSFPAAYPVQGVDASRLLLQGACRFVCVLEEGLDDDGTHRLVVSYRIAHDSQSICYFCQESSSAYCQPAVLAVDAGMRRHRFDMARGRLEDAAQQPWYAAWFEERRAKRLEVEHQKRMGCDVSVGAIVCVDAFDERTMDRCLSALAMQSVVPRALCVMGPHAKRALSRTSAMPESCRVCDVAFDLRDAVSRLRCDRVLLMSQNDILEPDAVHELVASLRANADALLAYCDDDRIDKSFKTVFAPRLKPDANVDALYAENYVGSCVLVRPELLEEPYLEGLDDPAHVAYAAALRLSATPSGMAHVARVLCHRKEGKRAQVLETDPKILADYLHERDLCARIAHDGTYNEVRYDIPGDEPFVSIVIPTKDHAAMLAACVDSILAHACYDSFEIVLVENNSVEQATFDYYDDIVGRDDRVKVVRFEGPFNYSKIVNFGVRSSRGDLLLLLNNDTEVRTDGFLRTMAGYFTRPEVGALGALLTYPDGLVQNAGIALMKSDCLGFMNQNRSPAQTQGYLGTLAHPYDYSAVLGACQMLRRSDFERVGGYDEELAVTYNDVDFCWKLREEGLVTVFTPYVEICHREFASRERDWANRERAMQTELEAARMRLRWPEYFACGDPVYNPGCNQFNPYFQLGS